MKAGTMTAYASKRVKEHILRFTRLYEQIRTEELDLHWLSRIESCDNIFPDIDYRIYKSR